MQCPSLPVFRTRVSHGLEKIESFLKTNAKTLFGFASALLFSFTWTYLISSNTVVALHEVALFVMALRAVERDVHADVTYYTKLVSIYFLSYVLPDMLKVVFLAVVLFSDEAQLSEVYASLLADKFFPSTDRRQIRDSSANRDSSEGATPTRRDVLPKFNTKFVAFKESCCQDE